MRSPISSMAPPLNAVETLPGRGHPKAVTVWTAARNPSYLHSPTARSDLGASAGNEDAIIAAKTAVPAGAFDHDIATSSGCDLSGRFKIHA